jgi:hypothetical protein
MGAIDKRFSDLLTCGDRKDSIVLSSFSMDADVTAPMDSWMKLHGTGGLPFIFPHSSFKCRR